MFVPILLKTFFNNQCGFWSNNEWISKEYFFSVTRCMLMRQIVPSGKEGQLIESDKKMACQSKEKVEALTMTKQLILRKRNLYTFSTTNGCDIILSKLFWFEYKISDLAVLFQSAPLLSALYLYMKSSTSPSRCCQLVVAKKSAWLVNVLVCEFDVSQHL